MSTMHKRLIAVAAGFVAAILPACAQRGAAHPTAMAPSGGFAVHSAPSFHSSLPAAPVRSSFPAPSQFSPNRYSLNRGTGSGYPYHHPGNDHGSHDHDFHYHLPYTPIYGLGLPYGVGYSVGYIPGYLDSSFYDNSGPAAPQPEPSSYQPDQHQAPPVDQAEAAPAPVYRPSYQRSQPASEPEPGPSVTLVFKDGRPNQQIQNYMLTRTTLYVQEQRLREIPVDQLDLVAMYKINSDAGVEFKLPGRDQ
jgi:hypothetical protein